MSQSNRPELRELQRAHEKAPWRDWAVIRAGGLWAGCNVSKSLQKLIICYQQHNILFIYSNTIASTRMSKNRNALYLRTHTPSSVAIKKTTVSIMEEEKSQDYLLNSLLYYDARSSNQVLPADFRRRTAPIQLISPMGKSCLGIPLPENINSSPNATSTDDSFLVIEAPNFAHN